MSARTPDLIVREVVTRCDQIEELITEFEKWEAMLLPEGVEGVSVDLRDRLSGLMNECNLIIARCEQQLGLRDGTLMTDGRSALHHVDQLKLRPPTK